MKSNRLEPNTPKRERKRERFAEMEMMASLEYSNQATRYKKEHRKLCSPFLFLALASRTDFPLNLTHLNVSTTRNYGDAVENVASTLHTNFLSSWWINACVRIKIKTPTPATTPNDRNDRNSGVCERVNDDGNFVGAAKVCQSTFSRILYPHLKIT